MEINNWLTNKGSFEKGLKLLERHCNNKHLIQSIKRRKNASKLRYELQKLAKKENIIKASPGKEKPPEKIAAKFETEEDIIWRELRILKYKLNSVAPQNSQENKAEALKLQLFIHLRWQALERIWTLKELKEFHDFEPEKIDFTKFSFQALMKELQRLKTLICRRKKSIRKIESQKKLEIKDQFKIEKLKKDILVAKNKIDQINQAHYEKQEINSG